VLSGIFIFHKYWWQEFGLEITWWSINFYNEFFPVFSVHNQNNFPCIRRTFPVFGVYD
jgi:hypothetical protein